MLDPAENFRYRTKNTPIENFRVNNLDEVMANTNGVLFRLSRLSPFKADALFG